jgi:hypothetical protein
LFLFEIELKEREIECQEHSPSHKTRLQDVWVDQPFIWWPSFWINLDKNLKGKESNSFSLNIAEIGFLILNFLSSNVLNIYFSLAITYYNWRAILADLIAPLDDEVLVTRIVFFDGIWQRETLPITDRIISFNNRIHHLVVFL